MRLNLWSILTIVAALWIGLFALKVVGLNGTRIG